MRPSSVGVWDLGYQLSAIIHSEREHLVEITFWQLFDLDATASPNRLCRDLEKPWQVEFNVASRKLRLFVPEPASGSVLLEVLCVTIMDDVGTVCNCSVVAGL